MHARAARGDLPERFENWSTAFRRFRNWREADVFRRILKALSDKPDLEYAMVDATIVKVHRHDRCRHLIENLSRKLKEFKRIAMRTCKTDRSFEAMIHLAAAVINSR